MDLFEPFFLLYHAGDGFVNHSRFKSSLRFDEKTVYQPAAKNPAPSDAAIVSEKKETHAADKSRMPHTALSHFLLLLLELLQQNVLRIAAGALDGAGIERIGQIGVAQRLEIAAAAAGLAEVEIVLPGRVPVLGVLLLELHRAHRRERVVDVVERVEVDVQLVIPVAAALHEGVIVVLAPGHVLLLQQAPLVRPLLGRQLGMGIADVLELVHGHAEGHDRDRPQGS